VAEKIAYCDPKAPFTKAPAAARTSVPIAARKTATTPNAHTTASADKAQRGSLFMFAEATTACASSGTS
jgi:hypothetical protein